MDLKSLVRVADSTEAYGVDKIIKELLKFKWVAKVFSDFISVQRYKSRMLNVFSASRYEVIRPDGSSFYISFNGKDGYSINSMEYKSDLWAKLWKEGRKEVDVTKDMRKLINSLEFKEGIEREYKKEVGRKKFKKQINITWDDLKKAVDDCSPYGEEFANNGDIAIRMYYDKQGSIRYTKYNSRWKKYILPKAFFLKKYIDKDYQMKAVVGDYKLLNEARSAALTFLRRNVDLKELNEKVNS